MSLELKLQENLRPRTFPCPKCKATINTMAAECQFCHAPIEPEVAKAAADKADRINTAVNEFPAGKFGVEWLFPQNLLEFLLFGCLGKLIWAGIFFVMGYPIFLVYFIRWWSRFGALQSDDLEFVRVRRAIKVMAILGAIFFFPLLFLFIVCAVYQYYSTT
jgi:hypothetical protein